MECPMHAAEKGHATCVELLVEHEGACRIAGLECPMHAAEKGHATCVELLAERERGMKTTRRWCGLPPGTTALDIAKERSHTAIASILSG